jgi:hypothetical protein
MFTVLTIMEFLSGISSIIGLIILCRASETMGSFIANCLCASTLLCLFLGQRIAKDYAGSQAIVSYFIVALVAIYLSYPIDMFWNA